MKPNAWIRQMRWATQFGIWLGTRRERSRIEFILENFAHADEDGREMVSEFKDELLSAIRGEQK